MVEHEYSVLGHSRASVGRWLTLLAGVFSIGIGSLNGLWLIVARWAGFPDTLQFVGIPVTAGGIYLAFYWAFNRWCWRWLFKLSGLPDIAGTWDCEGHTYDDAGQIIYKWQGEVSVSQNWERLKLHVRTGQSSSSSVSAALTREGGNRWMLMYSYRNEPRAGEEISPHLGYCEMVFEPDFKTAHGDYFTARGRANHGRMKLQRVK